MAKRSKLPKPVPVDYSSFGELGSMYQSEYETIWRGVAERWQRRRADGPVEMGPRKFQLPELENALRNYVTPGGLLMMHLLIMSDFEASAIRQVVGVWDNSIRKVFTPWASDSKKLVIDIEDYSIRRFLMTDIAGEVVRSQSRLGTVRGACFGPFTSEQMEYLLQNDPKIIEAGAGSGYFLSEFNARGGDGIGFDNNRYDLSTSDRFSWTGSLLSAGKLVVCSGLPPDEMIAGRTLMTSWAMPGSAMPAQILRRFTELGGQRVICKFGGFVGSALPTAYEQIFAFFQVLGKFWMEVRIQDRPVFNPRLIENNMFVFERKR